MSMFVVMRAFGEKLVETQLCETEQVDDFQNTEGVYKENGNKPPWLGIAGSMPERQTFPYE